MKYLIGLFLLCMTCSVSAGGWTYRGFHQGMSFEKFLNRAENLGYKVDECKKSDACAIYRPHDVLKFLTFTFCGVEKIVYRLDLPLEGRSLVTFVDALEDIRSTYKVDVSGVRTINHSNEIDGQPVHTTQLTMILDSSRTLEHGWWVSVSVSGFEPNTTRSNLNSSMGFHSLCE